MPLKTLFHVAVTDVQEIAIK